jgi:transcriptional regulator with XRE-family HTH domain
MSSTQPARPPRHPNQLPDLAEGLRALRLSKGLSLKEVALATDISTSFLSLVENGKSDITIGRLVRVVNLYGVTLTDLIPPRPDDSEPEITRVDERRLISHSSPAEGIDIYLVTPDTDRTMMPMELEFDPGAALAEYGRHKGEEWVYVVEGRLRLTLDGAEPSLLEQGDSAYYPADRPHLFANDDPAAPLRLICVNSPPNI